MRDKNTTQITPNQQQHHGYSLIGPLYVTPKPYTVKATLGTTLSIPASLMHQSCNSLIAFHDEKPPEDELIAF